LVLPGQGHGLAAAGSDSKLPFLGGELIAEPVVGYGPIVMNSTEATQLAVADFEAGRMGQLGAIEGSKVGVRS
jgi:redox-sensitive bicupin YhaK (pirin superfamily)